MWVRLLGLPLHLWSRPILKHIGDRCGGFVAGDENTVSRSDPRWARIRVKWDGSSNPRSVVVSEEDRSFVIQLWWEIQPQMSWESRTSKQNRGSGTREDGDASPRARESVELSAQNRVKNTEKSKGVLHREMGKYAVVERQSDEISSWEEQKLKIVVEQKRKGGSGRVSGCRCRLGPIEMGQERRRDRARTNGLGGVGGGGPSSNRAQIEGPEAKQTGPFLLLEPAPKKLSPVQIGPSESPAKKHLIEEQKSCSISPDWKQKKQNRGANPFNYWKEGDRRGVQAVIPSLEKDDPRYVRHTHENFSSSKMSVFGRPLLMGGSSGQEGPLKLKEIVDLEPLRMVAGMGGSGVWNHRMLWR